jgi:branched-chain amino acid transport system permease protein
MTQYGFVLVDGITSGATYALAGAAFGLVFFVTGRFHFAFGLFYGAAGMVAAWSASYLGWPTWLAVLLGLAVGTLGGVLSELLVYRALDRRSTGLTLLGVFIASLGLVVAGEALMSLVFNQEPTFNITLVPFEDWRIDGVAVPYIKATDIIVCWVLLLALSVITGRTHFGRQMKAVEANPDLSATFGIDPKRVGLAVFALISFVGAVLGILAAGTTTASPQMGDSIIIYAIVVAFLGRGRSILAIGLIGEVLGIVEALVGYRFGQLPQSLVVFVILFAFVVGVAYQPVIRRLRLSSRSSTRPAR